MDNEMERENLEQPNFNVPQEEIVRSPEEILSAAPEEPAYPAQEPAYPAQEPAYPAQEPAYPPQEPVYPAQEPVYPPQEPVYPPQEPVYPPQEPAYPAQEPAYPPQEPAYPPQEPVYPPQGPAYPAQGPAYPPQGPAYPPQGPAYPPQGPAYPPQGPVYPPQGPAYPPQGPAYPPQGPAYPPEGAGQIPQEPQGYAAGPYTGEAPQPGGPQRGGKKFDLKKRLPLLIAAAAVVVVAVLLIVLLPGGKGGGKSSTYKVTPISVTTDEDEKSYIVTTDGKVYEDEEVTAANLTLDQKHFVVLLEDGTLYFTNRSFSDKKVVADNARGITGVRNDGFFFTGRDSRMYRVSFSDPEPVELGKDISSLAVADHTLSVAYAKDSGVYKMPYNAKEGAKIDGHGSSANVCAISDDGQIAVWAINNGSTSTVYLCEGDDKTTLGKTDYSYDATVAHFTQDQKLLVLTSYYNDQIFIKKPGKEVVKVKLGNELYSSAAFCADGPIEQMNANQVKLLYVLVDSDSSYGGNLYSVTMDGERERVMSKVSDFYITKGKLFYIDDDDTLYAAKISGATVSDEKKIATEIEYIQMSEDGEYLYYLRDDQGDGYTLYCLKVGSTEPAKISSDVDWYFEISPVNGGKVYYLKDIEYLSDYYEASGVLYSWSYSKKASTKIAGDVMAYSPIIDINNDKGVIYVKNGSSSSRGTYGDLYYYNGKDSSKIASDIMD